MLNTIGKFLNSALPVSIAVGGLSKIDPRFKKFFYSAGLAGYGTDAALDYLRNQFEGEGSKQETNRLQEREQSGNARPDELQALRTTQQNEVIPNAIQKGVSVGAGLAGGLAGMGANAAVGALAGQGEPETPQPQQPNPKQPSPMSGAALEQDVQSQGIPQDQSAQQNDMMQNSLSEIISHIKNRMSHGGRTLEQATQEVGSHKQFRPIVDQIERSGVKFADWVRQQLGGQKGQMGQMGQNQGSGKKDQILQGMNSLTQAIQGFKR